MKVLGRDMGRLTVQGGSFLVGLVLKIRGCGFVIVNLERGRRNIWIL
jgi:hypothetical protein